MENVQVTSTGIKKHLHKNKPKNSIAEFIWNGFDANASSVDISYIANEIGTISDIQVKDDGEGISYQKLSTKFTPFLESEKEVIPNLRRTTSDVHGKNGVGRLTFFTFASKAIWETTFRNGKSNESYEIEISSDKLETYIESPPQETALDSGTTVSFKGIFGLTKSEMEGEIREYLCREFGWFLELNKGQKRLTFNGEPFNYELLIAEREEFTFELNEIPFTLRFVQWAQKLNEEYSRYYLLDSQNTEKLTKTTTLNNKGDGFYHSLFINSSYFDKYGVAAGDASRLLFENLPDEDIYKDLTTRIEAYLLKKRKPFLKEMVGKVIKDLEVTNAFPEFGNNEWEKIRLNSLKSVIGELFQIEPKIFSDLNNQQKRTFVHLLNLVMDSNERDALLEIIGQVVRLSDSDRLQLAKTLKTTALVDILKTIKFIEDRFAVVADLRKLVFDKALKAKEVPHLQSIIEDHYWLFGEQYHLVTAAEPKFEEALRRFVSKVRNKKIAGEIDHPDKQKEMDIFMIRQQMIDRDEIINCVCIELKHPTVNLGRTHLTQIEEYRGVVLNTDEFNGKNISWEFHLVGNKFDTSKAIEYAIESNKHHGEKSLVASVPNCKMFVRTWSQVFADFELRHNFLIEKLRTKRDELASEQLSADEITFALGKNSASAP